MAEDNDNFYEREDAGEFVKPQPNDAFDLSSLEEHIPYIQFGVYGQVGFANGCYNFETRTFVPNDSNDINVRCVRLQS